MRPRPAPILALLLLTLAVGGCANAVWPDGSNVWPGGAPSTQPVGPLELANQAHEGLLTLQAELNILQRGGYVSAKLHDQIDPFLDAAFDAVHAARSAAKSGDLTAFADFMARVAQNRAEAERLKAPAVTKQKSAARLSVSRPAE